MADLAVHFNTLITATQLTNPTSTDISAFVIALTAILTAQFAGDRRTIYRDDADEIIKSSKIEFDFIVVGSGAGGSVMAGRLTEASEYSTVIFEAGCTDPDRSSQVPALFSNLLKSKQDWQYVSKDKDACTGTGGCIVPRGKMFCGTPALNVMYYDRGDPKVYDEWRDDFGCNGWGYKDVLRYFKKSERNTDSTVSSEYHCSKGSIPVSYYSKNRCTDFILAVGNEKGYPTVPDINVPRKPSICRLQGTLDNGRRVSPCEPYINDNLCRKNLKIFKCAVVTKVILKNNKAIGVEFSYKGKQYSAYARKEVILSAGTFGTPTLLQLSGIGLKEDLKYNNIAVYKELPTGRNLQDLYGAWLWFSFSNYKNPSITPGELFNNILSYYSPVRGGDFAGIGTLPVVEYITIPPGGTRSNVLVHFNLFTKKSTKLLGVLKILGYNKKIADKLLQMNQNNLIILVIPALQYPKSSGYVRVDGVNGANAFNNPYIFFNYLGDSDKSDRKTLVKAMQYAQTFSSTPTWKAAGASFIQLPICDQYKDVTSDEYCNCYLGVMTSHVFHPVGTCRMGPTPKGKDIPKTVVNPQCQVHGIEGLTVADASITPKISSGISCIPTVMIGEKCADDVKKRNGIKVREPKCEVHKICYDTDPGCDCPSTSTSTSTKTTKKSTDCTSAHETKSTKTLTTSKHHH